MAHIREIKGRFYVCYTDPAGKKTSKACGEGSKGRTLAQKLKAKVEAELLLNQYEDRTKETWLTFIDDYFASSRQATNRPRSQETTRQGLANFTRIARPRLVAAIDSRMIDRFAQKRKDEPGKRPGTQTSAATVNKELRFLKAALNCAKRWGYIRDVPDIRFLPEEEHEPTFMTPETFALLYDNADAATLPELPNGVTPGDFWRALLQFIWFTGWRINQILTLERGDIDLDAATILTPASRNKGRRDVRCGLHPLLVADLQRLMVAFTNRLFDFPHAETVAYSQLDRIADAAGVELAWGKKFHEIRRGFSTANVENLNLFELQRLMQHKSLETTRRYVAMAHRSTDTVAKLSVPPTKRREA